MSAAVETDKVGQIIDKRYQITNVLGRGGMGTVYRAEHVRLRRPIALKLLHPSFKSLPEIGRRFEREAFAAARLDHPNCVSVSDFGELEDGTLFLAMEIIDGVSLGDLIDDHGAIEPARALHIISHVLRGLSHAHQAEIVHRDVKPENVILIDQAGDQSFAKILDFGIAKLRGAALEDEGGEKLTQAGVAFGTPIYISPEQASGSEVDQRADLYSTSCMLFEMLTGTPPFHHDDRLKILSMHLARTPPSLGEVNPQLLGDDELNALVQKGLQKQPEDRYKSADEYLAAVQRYLSRPVAPPPVAAKPAPTTAPVAAHVTPAPELRSIAEGSEPVEMSQELITPAAAARAQTPLPYAPTGMVQTPMTGFGTRPALPWWQTRKWITIGIGSLVFLLVLILALSGGDSGGKQSHDQMLRTYKRQLVRGKTCKVRREAVRALRRLGDKRAIPALRSARFRMRGGVLGIGDKNANHCLRKEAEAAIKALKK